MKFLIVFLISLVLLPIVSASDIDINFSKTSYSSGESAWAQVTSNVNLSRDLTSSDFIFTQSSSIPITKALTKVSKNTYFFYFEIPKLTDGDYKIELKSIDYVKNNVLVRNNFTSAVKIENKNQTIYFWPAVLFSEYLDQENPVFADILLKNIGWEKRRFMVVSSNDKLVNSITPFDFTLIGQSVTWVDFRTDIEDYTPGFKTAKIMISTDGGENYEYPIIMKKKWYAGEFSWNQVAPAETPNITTNNSEIPANNTITNITNSTDNTTYVYPSDSLKFIDPAYKVVEQTLKYNGEKVGVDWTLKNFAEQPLHNITALTTSDLGEIVKFELENKSILAPGEEIGIKVVVYPNMSKQEKYTGRLEVSATENTTDYIEFHIKFVNETVKTENNTLPTINTSTPVVNKTQEKQEEKSNSTALIIVLFVIMIIGIVALIFYKKSKPRKERLDEYLQNIKK